MAGVSEIETAAEVTNHFKEKGTKWKNKLQSFTRATFQ